MPIRFTPDSSKHANKECGGVNIVVTDRRSFDPIRTGLSVAHSLRELYAGEWDTGSLNRLLGCDVVLQAIRSGVEVSAIGKLWDGDQAEFLIRRARYLSY